MSNVIALPKPNPLPADLPAMLRALADDVEQGKVESIVIGMCRESEYELIWPSSLIDSIVLSAMLNDGALRRMRA